MRAHLLALALAASLLTTSPVALAADSLTWNTLTRAVQERLLTDGYSARFYDAISRGVAHDRDHGVIPGDPGFLHGEVLRRLAYRPEQIREIVALSGVTPAGDDKLNAMMRTAGEDVHFAFAQQPTAVLPKGAKFARAFRDLTLDTRNALRKQLGDQAEHFYEDTRQAQFHAFRLKAIEAPGAGEELFYLLTELKVPRPSAVQMVGDNQLALPSVLARSVAEHIAQRRPQAAAAKPAQANVALRFSDLTPATQQALRANGAEHSYEQARLAGPVAGAKEPGDELFRLLVKSGISHSNAARLLVENKLPASGTQERWVQLVSGPRSAAPSPRSPRLPPAARRPATVRPVRPGT